MSLIALNNEVENFSDDETEVGAEWAHERLANFRARDLKGHKKAVTKLALFQEDRRIVSCDKDGDLRLWDLYSGQHIAVHYKHHSSDISSLAVMNNDKTILTTSWDKSIKALDIETAKLVWTKGHDGLITSGDLSKDDKFMATTSDADGILKIWDGRTGERVQEVKDLHHSATILSLKWMSEYRLAAGAMDGTIKVWDMKTHRVTVILKGHKHAVTCMDVREGGILVTGSWDRNILIWDLDTGKYRANGPLGFNLAHDGSISSVQFHHMGKILMSAGFDRTINIWDLETISKKTYLKGHNHWINDAKLSKDLNWIVSGSNDRTVRLWDLQQKEEIKLGGVVQSHGLEMVKCEECEKPFSVVNESITICVFCRRKNSKSR